VSGFTLSTPFEEMLHAASIDPARLNDVIDRRLAKRREAVLRPSHPHLVQVRQRTGVPLMMVVRRRRHLLIEVESRVPFWRYKEVGRSNCRVLIEGSVPETVASAGAGKRLGTIIGGLPILANLLIGSITSAYGFIELEVQPDWRKII
jgi:hypothetical protein